jgi:acyl-CoA reductase-like NAD-dependent aldehyde dehydrogenase
MLMCILPLSALLGMLVRVAHLILRGKFWNCGQTCITSDYILCHKDVEKQLIQSLKEHIEAFYGKDPQKSESYPRIISERQLKV